MNETQKPLKRRGRFLGVKSLSGITVKRPSKRLDNHTAVGFVGEQWAEAVLGSCDEKGVFPSSDLDNEGGRIVSLFYGILDSHELTWEEYCRFGRPKKVYVRETHEISAEPFEESGE